MPTFSDSIDRITKAARLIRATHAANKPADSLWFTSAVLDTPDNLPDLVRDIDEAELGLFTLIPPEHAGTTSGAQGTITRVEYYAATPLRRPKTMIRPREPDPEVYTQAALKHLDRYQSIRPMPRARAEVESLMERLATSRERIAQLSQEIGQTADIATSDTDDNQPPLSKNQSLEEEKHIEELQAKLLKARDRRENLFHSREANNVRSASRSSKTSARPRSPPKRPADGQEDDFWSSPGVTARTGHFTGSLLTEEDMGADLNDVSLASIASPTPIPATRQRTRSRAPSASSTRSQALSDVEPDMNDVRSAAPASSDDTTTLDDDAEKTVMMTAPPLPPATPVAAAGSSTDEARPAETPADNTSNKKPQIRITPEVERLVVEYPDFERIWITVGEIIMPGRRFDAASGQDKPPRAKETIAYLEGVSVQIPSPISPTTSHSSFSLSAARAAPPDPSKPTSQQVLTAYLLLALLSSPTHSMPLNAVRETLANKAGETLPAANPVLGQGGAGNKAYFACVAKKLLKVDRGSREQVVKFNV